MINTTQSIVGFVVARVACQLAKQGVLLLLSITLFATWLKAQAVDIAAPSFQYQPASKSYLFEDARLTVGNWIIFAPQLRMDEKRTYAEAEGLILFRYGSLEGSAQRIFLKFSPLSGQLDDVALYDTDKGLLVQAKHAELKANGQFELYNCSITLCPPPLPAWQVKATRLKIFPNGFVHSINSRLHFFSVPLIWFPWLSFPPQNQRLSGFLFPDISNKNSTDSSLDLGWRIKIPYFQTLGTAQDLTIIPEWTEKQAGGVGVIYRYAWQEEQRGNLSWYKYQGEQIRQWLNFDHSQGWNKKIRLTLSYAHSSDGLVRRQYGEQAYHRPWQAWRAGLSGQGSFDWSVAGYRNSQLRHQSLASKEQTDSDIAQKAQLSPRLMLQGARQWSYSARGRFQLSWQAEDISFLASEALSGHATVFKPQLEWAQGLGPFEAQLSAQSLLVNYQALRQYHSTTATTETKPNTDFRQDAAQATLRLPLERSFFANSGGLLHRFVPSLGFQWRQKNDEDTLTGDPLIPEQKTQKDYTLLLKNNWNWGQHATHLNLLQRYDALQKNSAAPAKPESKEALLPLITQLGWQFAKFYFSNEFRYHHQKNEISKHYTTIRLTNLQFPANRTDIWLVWDFNRYEYQDQDLFLQVEVNDAQLNAQLSLANFLHAGAEARWNLDTEKAPQKPRLQSSSIFLEFAPVCYQLRVSFSEEIVSLQKESGVNYVSERRTAILFKLAGW